jgi:hypothetical protein
MLLRHAAKGAAGRRRHDKGRGRTVHRDGGGQQHDQQRRCCHLARESEEKTDETMAKGRRWSRFMDYFTRNKPAILSSKVGDIQSSRIAAPGRADVDQRHHGRLH